MIDILDPERIAVDVPRSIGMYIAGIFHVTTLDKLGSILRKGLYPGGISVRKKRMDSHFTPFFPTDPRNEFMQKRLDQAQGSNERLIVLSCNQEEFLKRKIRLCLANGFLLTDEHIPSTAINIVYELQYGNRGWDHIGLYHQHAAEHALRGCRQGRMDTGPKIAWLLSSNPAAQKVISQECQDDSRRYT